MKKILFSIILIFSLLSTIRAQPNEHPIEFNKPSISFFEGAVLGNGAMGVVVRSRPDAICFHFGHNNVWDIRIAENNKEKIGTFSEIFAKADALPKDLRSIWDHKEFADYLNMTAENYHKPYPRPFPCGTVILSIDRKTTEVLGHKIDIENGICNVFLLHNNEKIKLEVVVDMTTDNLAFSLTDMQGLVQPSCFNRVRVMPDPQTPNDIPQYTRTENLGNSHLGFTQTLPYAEPQSYNPETGHPKDKAFRLEVKVSSRISEGVHYTNQGLEEPLQVLEKYIETSDTQPFFGMIRLTEGLKNDVENADECSSPNQSNFTQIKKKSNIAWKEFWSKSSVSFSDKELEKIWYRNLYFFNCALREGVTCPGIFANWSYGNIGTAWHGDYHLNYNTQQPFWVTFSSNHLDKNLPYVDLVHHMLPISKKWAEEYYGMRGAFFPHSAYPVDMNLHPYPVPDWGWEVFETPWTVQGLWWHYLYTKDKSFLKDRAFEPIKDATLFLVDYMTRSDAHGKPRWNDNKYHIFPSVPPELYGLQPGFKYNFDTQIDITLAKFVFKAYLEAVEALGTKNAEATLSKEVRKVLNNMPEYSTCQSKKYGEIYTSVPEEEERIVYNVPANLTHVFPGDEFGLDSPENIYNKLVNTYKAHQNEGGNDIVFLNMQAARLGVLDIEKFKRQINYCTLPNGTVSDLVLQSGGRYNDQTDFDYMAPMGIWFENFALPAVINECLMQSYNGIINLFPNWDMGQDASFTTLRAQGAFLVSCSLKNKEINLLRIESEKGGICKIKNPWKGKTVQIIRNGKKSENLSSDVLTLKTTEGDVIELTSKF